MSANVDLNDLPKFSVWPSRLLGAKEFTPRNRTKNEVLREYDVEKWGAVLEWIRMNPDFTELDLLQRQGIDPNEKVLFMSDEEFLTDTAKTVMEHYDRLLVKTIEKYDASVIVELGCGLGDKLLKLARTLKSSVVYGGEFTISGVSCAKLLAKRYGTRAEFGHFDYNDPLTLASVPEHAFVYSSHSIEQIPHLSGTFVEGLIQRKPKCVVHFEPCYEDQDDSSLTGLLRRKYTELNDYNRNLVGLLKSYEQKGQIKITEHRPNVFSDTPFNPTSVIIWTPT
jgi:hypothetical protein